MAEVYGNIGDQPVELNNAATETTLAALLQVARAQFDSQTKGKDFKAQRDLEKKLKDLAAASQNSSAVIKQGTKERKSSIRAIRKETEARNKSTVTYDNLKRTVKKTSTELLSLTNSIANMGNSITSATSALTNLVKEIPVIGGVIGSSMDMIASSIDKTHQNFMQVSMIGANFGSSIEDMIDSATSAGLTIDQFSKIISNNGESLALLSTSSAQGAKRFADLGKAMRQSNIQDQLANLGFNTETINEGMANYIGIIGKSGRLQELNDRQLVELTGEYLKELDAVSKLTGKNRKDLEAEAAARMRDAQVRLTMSRLTADDQKQLHTLMNLIPEEHRKGFKDILATGTATTQEAERVFQFLPSLAQNAVSLNQQIVKSGRIAADASEQVYDEYQREASNLASSNLGGLLAAFTQDAGTFMIDAFDIASREGKTLGQALAEVEKSASKTSKGIGEMSPAELVKAQQGLAESSNELNKELLKFSTAFFDILNEFNSLVQNVLIKTIRNVADEFNKLYKIFKEDGFSGVVSNLFDKLVDSIFKGMKDGVDYLVDLAEEIGEKISTGFVRNMPEWLKSMFGIEDKTPEQLHLEYLEKKLEKVTSKQEREKIQSQIDTAKTKIESPEEKRLKKERDEILSQYTLAENTGVLTDDEQKYYESKLKEINKELKEAERKRKELNMPNTDKDSEQTESKDLTEKLLKQAQDQTNKNNKSSNKAADKITDSVDSWIGTASGLDETLQRNAEDLKKQADNKEKQTKENTEAIKENTEAAKDLADETKAASSCELDYSSPQALFNSFAKIMIGGKEGVSDSIAGTSATQRPPSHIGIGSYEPVSKDVEGLKKLIYQAEGTSDKTAQRHGFKSGYDVTYGYGQYAKSDKPLSQMTVAEVKEFQKRQIAATKGKIPGTDKGTGAVGKAQITQTTLLDLQKQMGFKDTDVFSPELQDQMMNRLLKRSGLDQFKKGILSEKQFQNRLAGTWASIGRTDTGKSAYGQATSGMTAFLPEVLAGIKDPNLISTPSESQKNEIIDKNPDNEGSTTPSVPGAGAPNAGNASAANSMIDQYEMLNTQINQLVMLDREVVDVLKRQLSVLKNQSVDKFS